MRMRFEPERASGDAGIDPGLPPPCGFIAVAVDLAMVSPAQGDGELIAHLAPERPLLRKAQMMGVGRSPAADETGLLGNELTVIAVPNPARFGECQQALVDRVDRRRHFHIIRMCGAGSKSRHRGLEGLLDPLGVGRRQTVLRRQPPVRPGGGIIAGAKTSQFGEKLIAQFEPMRRPRDLDWHRFGQSCQRGEGRCSGTMVLTAVKLLFGPGSRSRSPRIDWSAP